MHKFYTSDYEGEMITDSLSWRDGNKEENSIWIPKTIFNEDPSESAFIIGNGPSRNKHNLQALNGIRASRDFTKSLAPENVGQSYGCNLLYKDFTPTFLICFNAEVCASIQKSGYANENIVYSNRENIVKYPGILHLYPHYEKMFAGPAAARLAAADGHKNIFLIGFDLYSESIDHIYPQMKKSYQPITDFNAINSKLIHQLTTVFNMYEDVNFYHVQGSQGKFRENIISEFNWCHNLTTIDINTFTSISHLGVTSNL